MTNQCTVTSLQLLWYCESTCSGVKAQKNHQNVVLRTTKVHSFCGADSVKQDILKTKFWELWNGFCDPKVHVEKALLGKMRGVFVTYVANVDKGQWHVTTQVESLKILWHIN